MPDERAKRLVERFEDLRSRRGTWENHWQEIADYGLGRRDFQVENVTPGRKRLTRVYDNTFLLAAELLAAGLHSLLSNPATRWFRLKLEDANLMEIEEVARWVEAAENRLYNAFNRPEAKFTPTIHEAYIDLVSFGTGGVFVKDAGPRGIVFMAAPISTLYLGESDEGHLDTYAWIRKLPAREVQRIYGKGALRSADRLVEQQKFEDKIDVLRIVLPRTDPQHDSLTRSRLPWASFHVAREEMKVVDERGYEEDPFAVARWNKEPGEIYGRGPGIVALPEQKFLNEIGKTLLKAAQKRTDPPLLIPSDGVITQLQTQPGGISVAKSAYMQSARAPIFPLDTGGDLGIGVEMLNLRRQAVRSAFHWELLQLIQQPHLTATHVERLAEIQQRITSPILGRLQSELLEKLVERTFGIELRNGRLPLPIPAALLGRNIRVEYISPVVRAQKNFDAQAVRRVLATAAEFSQFDPSVLHNIESDEALRVISEAEGVPATVLRDRKTVERMREADRQLAEEQARQAALQQAAETASKAAPALAAVRGRAALQ